MDKLRSDLKCEHILDYESADFEKNFCKFIEEFKPRFLVDAVGGEMSGRIFEKMPMCSEMILLGNLSNESLKLNATEFFMHSKRIRGFNLEDYFYRELPEDRRKHFVEIIQDDFNKNSGELFGKVSIAKELKFDEWQQALQMVESLQDQGKILLKMC